MKEISTYKPLLNYQNPLRMKPVNKRTIEDISKDLERARGHLNALEKSNVFKESDKAILRPKWKQTIKEYQEEYDTTTAKYNKTKSS